MGAPARQLVVWQGTEGNRWETALIDLSSTGIVAEGTQIGLDPVPYRLDYTLDASDNFVTRALDLRACGEDWERTLALRHDGQGYWEATVSASSLPAATLSVDGLSEARDCDLGLSPLTNLMPLRRLGLLSHTTTASIVVAWVSVPDLELQPYRQRYERIALTESAATVRFIDEDLLPGFVADLELDSNGIVENYPSLARRVRMTN